MPAGVQKAMDYTLVGLQNTYCFLDDIIIVSMRSESDHMTYVTKCLKKLDDHLRINLQKCFFLQKQKLNGLGTNLLKLASQHLEIKLQPY